MSAAETDWILDVDRLAAGYLGTPVVRDVSLRVAGGEVVALLGPNGAGKTTTLAAIAGLIAPLDGAIRFAGEDVTGQSADRLARAGLALVPEGRELFFDLTAREHLRLAGRVPEHVPVDELLELLPELEKCLDRKAGVLSGGEQQMLALGRGLVRRPRLLLLDEMSLGLAPVIVERMMPVLRRVADELGTAVLVVEQHVALALEVADRAYVLNHGRLVLEGPATRLRESRELLRSSYLGDSAVPTRSTGVQV